MCKRKTEKLSVRMMCFEKDRMDHCWKEGATHQGVQVPVQAGKGKEVGSRLDLPEMDTVMLTAPFQPTENHSDL